MEKAARRVHASMPHTSLRISFSMKRPTPASARPRSCPSDCPSTARDWSLHAGRRRRCSPPDLPRWIPANGVETFFTIPKPCVACSNHAEGASKILVAVLTIAREALRAGARSCAGRATSDPPFVSTPKLESRRVARASRSSSNRCWYRRSVNAGSLRPSPRRRRNIRAQGPSASRCAATMRRSRGTC